MYGYYGMPPLGEERLSGVEHPVIGAVDGGFGVAREITTD
jgi:hypothetical protein